MSGNEELGTVNIQRGIFKGDALSPLLFVIGLIFYQLQIIVISFEK